MINESNGIGFEFWNRCAYVSAQRHVKKAMAEIEDITDPELWDMLDECLCKLKQKVSREAANDD